MDSRTEMLNSFYTQIDEDNRLVKSRHGQVEFLTTMNYIHNYLKPTDKIIEIGAGTGRYSISLAKEGYDVTAVELVNKNIEELKNNAKGLNNIKAYQGDALDLSRFEDNTFDITLVFGPMYHLYDSKDQMKCIDEAIRVTKPNGKILVAFLSIYAIMYSNYLTGNFDYGYKENFDDKGNVIHFEEQLFTGFDINEFEKLFDSKNVNHLKTVAIDTVLEAMENRSDFEIKDEDFDLFMKYHLQTCELREMLGCSNHLLYICEKK